MPIPIVMPQLGESVAEGTVVEWLKQEGDRVEKDEALLAISTEKVDAEIPAPASGVLSRILVKAGEAAPVGATLALIEAGFASGTGIDLGSEAPILVPLAPEPATLNREPGTPHRGDRFYSPAVRRLADELKVNLAEVPGTGEDGRVTKRDVEEFARTKSRPLAYAGKGETEAAARPAVVTADDEEELLPLTRMRRTIADHMARSLREAPTVTSVAEADFTVIAKLRERRKAAFREAKGTALTFLPFLVKATAHLLPEFPTLNARWTEEGIRVRKHVHLGIAVALPDGLVVPVLRSPASLPVSEIAVRIADVARRAQEGRLLPEELTGGTFTVNNFGADGNLIGTPVLNQPEVGILGVGTIGKRVVVVSQSGEDTLAIRWMGYLCLAYDHRAVDGAVAGRFLQRLRRSLETFTPGDGIWSDPFL
jgi:2-oxoglutarate dehydrogenase E2 component (dihydrolipoamide succinyltransferase)/2-oxoisovalerate dehydrogenase E2 component (dihydrolipoyl transacylase)